MATTTIEAGPAAPQTAPIPVSDSDRDWNEPEPNAPTRASGHVRARARENTAKATEATLTGIRRFTGGAILDARPATIREVAQRTKQGGWMPGDRAQWLETLGKAYGYGIALPCTVLSFTLTWAIQRPTRLLFLFVLGIAVRWAL